MTYVPPDPYPYRLDDVDYEWLAWWQHEIVEHEYDWLSYACGYAHDRSDRSSWVCTLPKGHQCRHVGHVSSGAVCGLGYEVLPPELRVSEGL